MYDYIFRYTYAYIHTVEQCYAPCKISQFTLKSKAWKIRFQCSSCIYSSNFFDENKQTHVHKLAPGLVHSRP